MAESIVELHLGRSRRFLREMGERPFVALVVLPDDRVRVYTSGIGHPEIGALKKFIEELENRATA